MEDKAIISFYFCNNNLVDAPIDEATAKIANEEKKQQYFAWCWDCLN